MKHSKKANPMSDSSDSDSDSESEAAQDQDMINREMMKVRIKIYRLKNNSGQFPMKFSSNRWMVRLKLNQRKQHLSKRWVKRSKKLLWVYLRSLLKRRLLKSVFIQSQRGKKLLFLSQREERLLIQDSNRMLVTTIKILPWKPITSFQISRKQR